MDFSHIDFSADAVGCPYLALVLLLRKVDIKRVHFATTPSGDPRRTWIIKVADTAGEISSWRVNLGSMKVTQTV